MRSAHHVLDVARHEQHQRAALWSHVLHVVHPLPFLWGHVLHVRRGLLRSPPLLARVFCSARDAVLVGGVEAELPLVGAVPVTVEVPVGGVRGSSKSSYCPLGGGQTRLALVRWFAGIASASNPA